jgi:outer membrane PBP1 activator LpoA protein
MELQRFYALGIDAYRIALWLADARNDFAPLDGVTGTISMDRERRLHREPVAAQFAQGEVKVLFRD